MKLAFVILNFNTYKETVECINSIFKHVGIGSDEYNITVVDNGSTDNSFERLINKFGEFKNIDVICTQKNLGFAKGNNFGIKHVNKCYSPSYVAVINSDTELIQDNFYQSIVEENIKHNFGVLGPMEAMADGTYMGPWKPINLQKLTKVIHDSKVESVFLKYRIEKILYFFRKVYRYFKKILDKSNSKTADQFHERLTPLLYQENVELHGAFLIFNKKVFDKISGFDDRTFLYFEEQLLYLSLERNNLISAYTPNIIIYHKEGRATKNTRGSSHSKRVFSNKCNLESQKILWSELYRKSHMQKK